MHLPIELQVALTHQADLRADARKLRFSFRRIETKRAVDGHRPRPLDFRPSAA
jgi:hypothetical protein